MLEIMGRGYVIEHCVSALSSLQEEQTFKAYTADCLKMIAESMGGQISARFADLVDYGKKTPKKEHTDEEVRANIKAKLRHMEGGES